MLARRTRMVASLAGSVAGVLCLAMSMPAGADDGINRLTDGVPVVGPAVPGIPVPPEVSGPVGGVAGQVGAPAAAAPALAAVGADPGAAATSAALPLLATAAPLLQSECSSDALALAQAALAGTGLPVAALANPAAATGALAGTGVPVAVPDAPAVPAAALPTADLPVPVPADVPADPAIADEGLAALRLALNLAGIMVADLASGGAPCSASVADATSGTPNLAG